MNALLESDPAAHCDRQNSLYVLPLSVIPLKTTALRRAQLIKNSRLESVVELFSGAHTGSGQIDPDHLNLAFRFDEKNESDIDVVQRLATLSSYDVYSLRLELRRLGIAVDHEESLQLPKQQVSELSNHMQVFTRPLVAAVYGKDSEQLRKIGNIVDLFRDPDIAVARRNLEQLSRSLGVEIGAVPEFLEEYGDVYLSLSYYQHCLDESMPLLTDFMDSAADMLKTPAIRGDGARQRMVITTRERLGALAKDVANVLEMFRIRTTDMWEHMSKGSFDGMRNLITQYQVRIGGILCALAVKMQAWQQRCASGVKPAPGRFAEFIRSDMLIGLDRVETINYADAG